MIANNSFYACIRRSKSNLAAIFLFAFLACALEVNYVIAQHQAGSQPSLIVKKCDDFTITGNGTSQHWNNTPWNPMVRLDDAGTPYAYETKFKILYSTTGIYVLFQGADHKITSKPFEDFESIFQGDVYEVFFHPNPEIKVYFEYEVNHLGKELILTISNLDGSNYNSWAPWHYEGINRSGIKKMVSITGGEAEINGAIKSWSAEIFFPFRGLGLLPNVPPESGTVWNANFCRLDYDSGKMVTWSWTPAIKKSFHELDKFLSIRFE